MTNENDKADKTREAVALADQLIEAAERLDCWVAAAMVEQAKHLLISCDED